MPSRSYHLAPLKVEIVSDHYYIQEIYLQGLNSFFKVDVNSICSSFHVMVGFGHCAPLA